MRYSPITPREKQIAVLVAQGKYNKEIAAELRISEGTVKTFLNRIYWKFGLRNRVALALAERSGTLETR